MSNQKTNRLNLRIALCIVFATLMCLSLALAACDDPVVPPSGTKYTVTFDTQGGSTVKAQSVKDGEKAIRPQDPDKADFGFINWYTEPTEGSVYDFDSVVGKDITVYARWYDASGFAFSKNADGKTANLAYGTDLTQVNGDVYLPQKVTVSDDVCTLTEIAAQALSVAQDGTSQINSVTVPATVTKIGDYAFWNLQSVKDITILGNLTEAGQGIFYECAGLQSVSLSGAFTAIPDTMFYNCANLESVSLNGTVTSVGQYAFGGCEKLATFGFLGELKSIGEGAFYQCRKLTNATVSADVTDIAKYAFAYCSELESIDFKGTVKTVGYWSFAECAKLNVDFLEGVTDIDINGFMRCNLPQTLKLDNLKNIGNKAFTEVTGLTDIDLPAVITLGNGAFERAEQLTNVKFGAELTKLGENAFNECAALTTVSFADGSHLTEIGMWAFRDCGITAITLPEVDTVGKQIFTSANTAGKVEGHAITVTLPYAQDAVPNGWNVQWAANSMTISPQKPNTITIVYANAN